MHIVLQPQQTLHTFSLDYIRVPPMQCWLYQLWYICYCNHRIKTHFNNSTITRRIGALLPLLKPSLAHFFIFWIIWSLSLNFAYTRKAFPYWATSCPLFYQTAQPVYVLTTLPKKALIWDLTISFFLGAEMTDSCHQDLQYPFLEKKNWCLVISICFIIKHCKNLMQWLFLNFCNQPFKCLESPLMFSSWWNIFAYLMKSIQFSGL